MAETTIFVAFLAGLVSFLAPCVLPIIPGFLAYLSGTSLKDSNAHRWEVFFNSVFFVLGFSTIFAILGVLLNTILEAFAYDVQIWLSRVGGALIIFFGLYLIGLIRIPFLEREHKINIATGKFKSRYITSFLFGAAFAAGWTPCVGAALGAILGLAATQPGIAFYLLLAYSIGLGIPFLIVGLFATQASKVINRFGKTIKYINIAFGILLIVFGVLIFTQNLARIASFELLNRILLN
ncbi:MAG: cytochrome C biogenesis protein [Candidatus Harrisonbacteria bacterium CG10_big_fil_rev_8_21_14_0_10_42_17]|uniref:Cytochrome C biogenesis protein n=1 Tax=Candidatus Harrisonbacteria bacterium CG10_big_fil_rev_8_21_14_0_10_42_17 TaxID=1974584 RepID=A0A2M6WIQ2_9BACT|nr:MAG: cytochrome C biogenesis protein [Candidatus Harrisonbacteria bacterium CG10_big_fil_rev_8_21_14_0_10_42_17]